MARFVLAALAAASLLAAAPAVTRAAGGDDKPLEVVSSVDLARYAGKWYEVARLPNRFQKKCAGDVTATYTLLGDGKIRFVNECGKADGSTIRAEGKARLAEKNGPSSKLEVRFAPSWLSWLPAVWGDYQIVDLVPDYSTAVVGSPDRKYLWFLSRTPEVDDATFERLSHKAAAQGFDVSKMVRTKQTR